MRIGDDYTFIEFELEEVQGENPGGMEAVSCSITVLCEGFSGKVKHVWFDSDDIDSFLHEFQMLEENRKGSATLKNMSSLSEYSPLTFEISSIDNVGHFILKAVLLKAKRDFSNWELHPVTLSVNFLIDSGSLQSMLLEFKKLLNFKQKLSQNQSRYPLKSF